MSEYFHLYKVKFMLNQSSKIPPTPKNETSSKYCSIDLWSHKISQKAVKLTVLLSNNYYAFCILVF